MNVHNAVSDYAEEPAILHDALCEMVDGSPSCSCEVIPDDWAQFYE
jgi:hypothetical protein